jgi:hypothetical protein
MFKRVKAKVSEKIPVTAAFPESGVVVNCITDQSYDFGTKPVIFGTEPGADIAISSMDNVPVRIVLRIDQKLPRIIVESGNEDVVGNNKRINSTGGETLPKESLEHTLQIGTDHFFLIKLGSAAEVKSWKHGIAGGHWHLHHWKKQSHFRTFCDGGIDVPAEFQPTTSFEPAPFLEILKKLQTAAMANGAVLVNREGSSVAFHGNQLKMWGKSKRTTKKEGALFCPRCWQRFDAGSMLAVHPTDFGDEELGEAEQRRFLPSRIGLDGRALDEDGNPCSSWACPHCRGKLPQGFHIAAPKMISLVGESSAGKSYFLTVSIRQLKRTLIREFETNFTDADAAENGVLNNMIATLFNARSSSEAVLIKTGLAGATYGSGMRFGKENKLPRPFTYQLSPKKGEALSMIVYDNAGEHFRPDVEERIKALATQHMAYSSASIFLFDPIQQSDLLRKLKDVDDPQIEQVKKERFRCDQEVILGEMAGRIREWKGLAPDDKPDFPLAFVVGKYDFWESLLPRDRLRTDIGVNGALNEVALLHNSNAVRSFLMNYCPEIVGAAEAVSSNVRYFPASPFGSSAVKVNSQASNIGPPAELNPFLVEAPWMWLFSRINPSLFKGDHA